MNEPPIAEIGSGRRNRGRYIFRRPVGDRLTLALMVGIPAVFEAVLIWIPALASVGLSFTHWDGVGGLKSIHGAGLSNYSYVLTGYPEFWQAVQHNLVWLGFLTLVATPLGMLIAILLEDLISGSNLYQSIFFVPVMLSMALIGIIWELIYSPDSGLINGLLGTAGSSNAIDWYGNPQLNIWAAVVAASWQQVGFVMILYLAGLKTVDPALRESAALDGANRRQVFFKIIFPVMRPINAIVAVVTFINALRAFDIVWVINTGTNGLQLLNVLVVKFLTSEGADLGTGSAIGTILLVASLVPVIAYLTLIFRRENQ